MSESKRTSITIDSETKQVFDWSMQKKGSKTTSSHLRELLQNYHEENDWEELAKKAREESCVCPRHNKPYALYCKTCDATLCTDCNRAPHKDHKLQYFCRKHEIAYDMDKACRMCEREEWETVIKVSSITPQGLKEEIEKTAKKTENGAGLIVIDTREDDEWGEGHLDKRYTYHIPWSEFKKQESEAYRELEKVVEQHRNSHFVVISQGYPQKKKEETTGSVRGFLGAVDMQLIHGVKDVAFLDGGWAAFHSQYPDIVEEHRKSGSCRVCSFYNLK